MILGRAVFVLAVIGGCGGGDSDDKPDGGDSGTTVDTEAPVVTEDTGETGTEQTGLSFLVAPEITGAPNPDTTPLVRGLVVETSEPTRLSLQVDDGTVTWELDFDTLATAHDQLLLGFRAGRTHDLTLTATSDAGDQITSALTVTTDPLPSDFPAYEVVVSDPARMEPGYTIVSPVWGNQPTFYFFAVDADGEVVWYHKPPLDIGQMVRMSTGNLLYMHYTGEFGELDMAGNQVAGWVVSEIPSPGPLYTQFDAFAVHHDVVELSHGGFATIGSIGTNVPDYPTSDRDPYAPTAPALVVYDEIMEITRDGDVLGRWPLLDLLDQWRVSFDALDPGHWVALGPTARDWNHSNSIWLDEVNNSWIISVRHQDAVLSIDHDSGDLEWILGPHANWSAAFQPLLLTPTGAPFEWNYHQHSARTTPDGTVMMFDNGNKRASAFEEPTTTPFSRALEFRVDRTAMTVELVWEYGKDRADLVSTAMGEVDWMPTTGNILITAGRLETSGSRIVEVTHDTPAEVVWELNLDKAGAYNSNLSRAERLSSLYGD